eukprot:m.474728 g.474728  ORF g.474728 m.474728 type:complete len:253 (-) comp21679_c0_seq5:1735-2493(-)
MSSEHDRSEPDSVLRTRNGAVRTPAASASHRTVSVAPPPAPYTPGSVPDARIVDRSKPGDGGSGNGNGDDDGNDNGSLRAWWAWYQRELQRRPLRTKMITSGVFGGLADMIAQMVAARSARAAHLRRATVAYTAAGALVTAPFMHVWFPLLNRIVPSKDPLAVYKRVVLDRLVGSPPFYFLFFFMVNAVNGLSVRNNLKLIRTILLSAVRDGIAYWSVVNLTLFTYVPVDIRLLFSNLFGLVWTAYLALPRT